MCLHVFVHVGGWDSRPAQPCASAEQCSQTRQDIARLRLPALEVYPTSLLQPNPCHSLTQTVDIEKALGKPHSLWCAFAKFYEYHGDVANARVIFEKAVQVPFKYVDDLAQVCGWVGCQFVCHLGEGSGFCKHFKGLDNLVQGG